jgi:hypothetical protein
MANGDILACRIASAAAHNGFVAEIDIDNLATGGDVLPAVAPDVTFSCQAPVQASVLAALNRRKASTVLTSEDTTTPVTGESGPSNVFIVNRKPNNPAQNRIAP